MLTIAPGWDLEVQRGPADWSFVKLGNRPADLTSHRLPKKSGRSWTATLSTGWCCSWTGSSP